MPIFSQTTEYAIRAMIEMARQPEGSSLLARELTDRLQIPHFYLAKILHQLTRAHLLSSVRGRGGGFTLARPPEAIPLFDVVSIFDDVAANEHCILGREACSDQNACPLHEFWKVVRGAYTEELRNRTVADLAKHEDLWRRPSELQLRKLAGRARKPVAETRAKN